ncbi:phage virion morphogenesis protein [Bowmanella denitrificans]|uniref:phage virion morphogenesis protein n=1 Tax=Bowmanella denitrificans TaxID=366582 RepID=UPI000C9C9C26|nr:phage virion morphogenesis protein [Bowmanella denitrificans]
MSKQIIGWDMAVKGTEQIKRTLQWLRMSPNQRRQFLRKVSRTVARNSNQRRRAQKDLGGQSWAPRTKGKGKMLRKVQRELNATANAERAMLYFKKPRHALIAYAHHHGIADKYSPANSANHDKKQRTEQQQSAQDTPTKAQAKKLIDLGFRINKRRMVNGKWRNGRSIGKLPSLRWIITNLNPKQVGALIGLLKKTAPAQASSKTQWQVPRQKRTWLGATRQETDQLINLLLQQLTGQLA